MPNAIKLHPDFVALLAAFANAEVRYLIIGGYAVGFHDRPRTTRDIDLLVDPSAPNVAKVSRALAEFGAPESVVRDFVAAGLDEIVWMGKPPLKVDLLKSAPGVDPLAFDRAIIVRSQDVDVRMISLDDLISAKRAVHRTQDVVDAENLELARRSRRRDRAQ